MSGLRISLTKLDARKIALFEVFQRLGPVTYEIDLPTSYERQDRRSTTFSSLNPIGREWKTRMRRKSCQIDEGEEEASQAEEEIDGRVLEYINNIDKVYSGRTIYDKSFGSFRYI